MKNLLRIATCSCLVGLVIGLAGCDFASAPKNELKIGGKTMGTFYNITIVGDYPGGSEKLQKDVDGILQQINDDISTFKSSSVLSKFNSYEDTKPYPITRDMARMIGASIDVGSSLNGAMDITVLPLVEAWGFGKVKVEKEPTAEEIAEAQKLVGLDKIHLEISAHSYTLRKDNPKVRVDLATVGEGFGVDKLAEFLDGVGIKNYMVSIAGAVRTKGVNGRGTDWVIAIEDPSNEHNVGARFTVPVCIQGKAISTSGSYRNFKVDDDGKRKSHIINPTTGKPIEHSTVSVSVIGSSALWTDAVDTGLMVLGSKSALEWANEHNIAIFTIEHNGEKFVTHTSRAMQQYLDCK